MLIHRVTVSGVRAGTPLPAAKFDITGVEPMEAHAQAMDRYRREVLHGEKTPGASFITAREEVEQPC